MFRCFLQYVSFCSWFSVPTSCSSTLKVIFEVQIQQCHLDQVLNGNCIHISFFFFLRTILSYIKTHGWYSLCIHWKANKSKAQVSDSSCLFYCNAPKDLQGCCLCVCVHVLMCFHYLPNWQLNLHQHPIFQANVKYLCKVFQLVYCLLVQISNIRRVPFDSALYNCC